MCEIHYTKFGHKHVNYCNDHNIDFINLKITLKELKNEIYKVIIAIINKT